jgi:ATP-binding protein involved in chromosome partitioning
MATPSISSGADASRGATAERLPGIRHIVAVASGKGGVGKSTVSVNLALALSRVGARVGLVDADILGPSIPVMLGLPTGQPPAVTPEGLAVPAERHGIKCMSMGMLTGHDSPAILRGPMVTKYLQMFVGGVAWGRLDYLVLDLPPGTGDIQLTLAQGVPLSGAIIVTTPQDVSLNIARRGLRMFEKVQVPILGVIENMSGFTCPHCHERTNVFSAGGGGRMSRELGVPFLGAIPLDADVVKSGDEGTPIVALKPDSPVGQAYAELGTQLAAQLNATPLSVLPPFVWSWDTGEGAPPWREVAILRGGNPRMPVGFRKSNARTLGVLWQDGRNDELDVRDLRLACACALCVDELSGKKVLDPKSVRPDVSPKTLSSVGNYALTVAFNDGHSSGIYSFELLRSLGDRARQQGGQDV